MNVMLVERALLMVAFLAIVVGIGAFDWRIGLVVGGVLLGASSLDIPWRRA